MTKPSDDEVVALVQALQEVASSVDIGKKGLQFMCHQAAKMIHNMRPDINWERDRR